MEAYQKHTDLRFNRADEHYCLVQSERLAGAPAGALDLVYVEPHQGEANHNKWFTDEIELEDFLIPDFEMNRLKMISSKGRTALRLRLKDTYWPIPVRRVIRVNLYPWHRNEPTWSTHDSRGRPSPITCCSSTGCSRNLRG